MTDNRLEFFNTSISKRSFEYVEKVLSSTYVSAGKVAKDFEKRLSDTLGLVNPVTVNSGTSALHLGLEVAGIGHGHEVILPAQTFVASGLAIMMTGATPVFADIQYETGNIDPKSIKKKITEKTKAIMPVHWAGYPCDMDEINRIAKENNLVLIEDAAHALGATYRGIPIGSISDFTAFSFQAIKHLTTGDGGALCCLDKLQYEDAKKRRWFGIDRYSSKHSILGAREYDIKTIGFKYHLNDIAAAVGLGNLEEFPQRLKKIRKIASIYSKELRNVPGLKLLDYKDDRESAYWLFTILVDNRLEFVKKMKTEGTPVSVVDQRIDRFSVFGGEKPGLVNQRKFNNCQISIPIHSALSEENVNKVINSIKTGW